MFRKVLVLGLLVCLAACNAAVKNPVSLADLYKARAAYDAAVLAPAARYASLPRCKVHSAPCSDPSVILKLQKVDKAASAALNAAIAYTKAHPTLDASAYISAAITAFNLAQQVAVTYGVK